MWFDCVRVRVVPRRTVVGDTDRRLDNQSGSHHQSHVNCITSVYGIYVFIMYLCQFTVFTDQRHKYRKLTLYNSHDSDDDFRSGCRNVGQCHQQQSFSGLLSPGRSNHTNELLFYFIGTEIYARKIKRVKAVQYSSLVKCCRWLC